MDVITTTITQAPEGWWNANVTTDDGTSLCHEEGLPTRDAATSLARAALAQHNVRNGRHADAATWGW